MLKKLRLVDFKGFRDATLSLGPFTLIIGANASGKSNVRDALRFLHGISRGYSLAEIIGEKWGEGGVLQWRGIRGGTKEVCFGNEESFLISVKLAQPTESNEKYFRQYEYSICVAIDQERRQPFVISEELSGGYVGTYVREYIYSSHPGANDPVCNQDVTNHIAVRLRKTGNQKKFGQRLDLLDFRPALSQILEYPKISSRMAKDHARRVTNSLEVMRFLDLEPDAMRRPSIPGQDVLGDRGENLSSVLYSICQDSEKKSTLLQWMRELTPMEAVDFEFPSDQTGRVLLTLVEESGRRTSAYSASDGTLRFLAMIAALIGPHAGGFYFFEEIDNGIHPTRLHLLLQLIEQQVAKGGIQVVATTHSPDLLALLGEQSREAASLVYRLPGRDHSLIRKIVDIPQARDVLSSQNLGRLHASGWLEDAMVFADEEGE